MEKYKRFTDPSTGINPFVPLGAPSSIKLVASLPLWPVIIAAVLISELVLVGLETLHAIAALIRLSGALRIVSVPLTMIVTRVVILVLYTGRLFVSVTPSVGKSTDQPTVQAGDALICNLQSPWDVISLNAAFPGTHFVYVFPCPQKQPDQWAKCWTMHRWVAMAKIASAAPQEAPTDALISPRIDLTSLQRQAKRLDRVVCFFAEGASSNGRGVLKIPYPLAVEGTPVITGVTYSCEGVTCSTPRSLLGFMFSAVAAAAFHWNRIDVTSIRPSATPPMPSSDASQEWAFAVQNALGKAASFQRLTHKSCKPLAISVQDKISFLEQWKSYAA